MYVEAARSHIYLWKEISGKIVSKMFAAINFFFFFLNGCPLRYGEVSGPGIESEPQPWQHWIL